ncbi:MAG: Na+/H+ antiporter subunit E [Puniceicoccaceae bacterium]
MPSLLMNLAIAQIWHLLMGGGVVGLVLGFAFGFVLLRSFKSLLRSDEYVRRLVNFFRFFLVFIRQFVLSNLVLARAILFKNSNTLDPNFFTYSLEGLRRWEIFLLSQCISLTPGTTSVQVSEDFKTLIIHGFDVDEPEVMRREIDETLKAAILAFSR